MASSNGEPARRRPSRIPAASAPPPAPCSRTTKRPGRSSASQVDSRCRARDQPKIGWPSGAVRKSPFRPGPEAVSRLAGAKLDPVFFFGSGPEARAFLQAAGPLGWRPRLLATGTAADDSLFGSPAAFDGRIFLALPSLPGDPAPQAAAAYRALASAYKLPQDSRSAQLSALAAAEALIEALRRAGRDVSREKLVDRLESLRAFPTGYVPPLTYGPTRRLGARGAYVMRLDLKEKRLMPEGGWVEVE